MPRMLFDALGDQTTKQKFSQTLFNTQPVVTQEDRDNGVKTRYFARYTAMRDGTIYELDPMQYASIQNNALFSKTQINWIIKGRLEDTLLTFKDGTSILVKGVISQNQTLLAIANEELNGILEHLQNHMEYWIGE